jgi:hypothetical protein
MQLIQKKRMLAVSAVMAAAVVGGVANCAGQAAADNHSDEWVATDALGRKVQHEADPRANRTVAMFYFLWNGPEARGGGPWDITRILKTDPDALGKADSPLWGPVGQMHYWGEPLFGYYNTDDKWVLRKHAEMLADAGVDVIIFDTSNKATYPEQVTALMEAFEAERKAGNKTPAIAFLTPFWDPQSTVDKLYAEIYSKNRYPDLWFRWDGKPLILANPAKVSAGVKSFFTFRNPQPDYFQGPTGPDMWSWLEIAPQHVFKNSKGEKEQMSVGVAQNAADGKLSAMSHPHSLGRSYHNGKWDTRPNATAWGLNFQEQWDNALREDPQAVFVTGWNEWTAGRFQEFNGYKAPNIFVDEYDQEHSRDIEPMVGGHGDDYYYQLVENVRKYKGSREPQMASTAVTIDLDGGWDAWKAVKPVYRDEVGDTFFRDHAAYNSATHLVNRTGRNDLVEMKVAHDAKYLYFYAETREAITPHTDAHWMTLFIDADRNHATGWEGYDYLINHTVQDARTTVIESTKNGWNWEPSGKAEYRVAGNKMMIRVARASVGLEADPLQFEFKWADNWQRDADINEFTVNGDAAPPGRFNYLYKAEK